MVRDFLGWWLGQLALILGEPPGRAGSRDAVVVDLTSGLTTAMVDGAKVAVRRGGAETALGQLRLGAGELPGHAERAGRPTVLRLAAQDVLGKTLLLPSAAEPRLAEVVMAEMDRETPFAADEVFWSRHVARRDRRAGRLEVRLLVVPRRVLAPVLEALARDGLRPAQAEIGDGPDRGRHLPLAAGVNLPRGQAPTRRRWAALACCGVTGLAAAAAPFARQAAALTAVEREIAAERAGAMQTAALRRQIDELIVRGDAQAGERAAAGRPLAVMADLTRLLPSDTYLTDLDQRQGKITITGHSASASRLIALLAADGRLHNPSFAAPVTRMAGGGEVFSITAEITR